MAPCNQARILELLVARGWIDEGEVPDAKDDDAPLDRVDLLVRRGLVDGAVVREIIEELLAERPAETEVPITEPATDRSAGRGAAPPHGRSQRAEGDAREGDYRHRAPESGDAAAAGEVPAELLRWERYSVDRLLGRGASGAVYVARDPRLDRRVAIKVLAGGTERALREARLQARVAHEGVCEVYEVGWVGDRPFVAMQLVDGETLHRAARSMTREAIVIAVRDAARAVHAAHRIGLVHRDLKPGNVMVERATDGAIRTFVVDFGLAKEVEGDGSSATGSVLGTPAFMAPEQARGDVHKLDRRTDVYGLGATLYAALSGTPPFPGEGLAVLHALLSEEPAPLRARDPSIPRVLETIAATCLEKDADRRYPTAAALADDLDRYLAGEPIAARRAGVFARAWRWARKHRAIAATSGAGLVAAALLAGGWARSLAVEREEAALARRLGEEAKTMESALRIAYLAPLHDTRADRAAIEARFPAIERALAGRGPAVHAAGAYAVGRGLLSLHRYAEARARLEVAWNEGDRSAALALSLAQALGALYDERLGEARRLTDPAVRASRTRELSEELVAPALACLKVAQGGESESPALVLGWIALYEGRHDEALAKAREALAGAPWLHEARKLEGDAHKRRAEAMEDAGKLQDALATYALAADAYEKAGEIARSDVEVHAAACRTYVRLLSIQADALGTRLDKALFDRGIDACERAIAADGGAPDPIEDEAHLLEIRGTDALDHGDDPREWLAAGIARAEDVALVFPERAGAFAALGLGHLKMATYESRSGRDPRPTLERGVDACERATELLPEYTQAHNYLGAMNMALAEDVARRGGDPRASIDRAIAAYEAAARLDPEFVGVWNNIGRAHALAAEHELGLGLPARGSLDAARSAYSKVIEALPEHPGVHNNLGSAWFLEAKLARSTGADPQPALDKALAAYERALELSPAYSYASKNTGDAHRLAAEYALSKGVDPGPSIARAVAAYEQALRSNPRYAGALRGMARAFAVAARARVARGEDAASELGKARVALDRAATLAPSDPDLAAARAELLSLGKRPK